MDNQLLPKILMSHNVYFTTYKNIKSGTATIVLINEKYARIEHNNALLLTIHLIISIIFIRKQTGGTH